MASDLVRRRVAVIVAQGSHYSALAAKAAANSIPIVFSTGVDPVAQGIVPSLSRPGGNVTGVVFMNLPAISKRIGILHEVSSQGEAICLAGQFRNTLRPGGEGRAVRGCGDRRRN